MSIEERETSALGDRRRASSGVRSSWASSSPFVPTGPESGTVPSQRSRPSEPTGRDRRRRRPAWERPLLLTVLGSDLAVAALVATATASSLHLGAAASLLVGVSAAAAWVAILAAGSGYRLRRLGSGPEEFQSLLRAALVAVALLGLAAHATQTVLPRRWVFVAIPVTVLLGCGARVVIRRLLHRERRDGRAMLRTLLVGPHADVAGVARSLASDPTHGYHVVGMCPPTLGLAQGHVAAPRSIDELGTISDVPQVVHDRGIDVVVVAGAALSGPALRRLSWALETAGADLVVAPGLVEITGPYVNVRPTAGLSLLHLERPSRHLGHGLGKLVLDRTLGAVLLVVALVPIALGATAMALTSAGSPFFRQTRVGLDGRPFTMWKLRSMSCDAEARRDELLAHSDRDGPMFKMRQDPRVTPVGRVLRKYSLDELPQLWNVVKGDMSLVGPRPPLMSEFVTYRDAVNRRLRVKPGLTGLWQVSGRADLDWEQSIALDLRYVDNWSLAMDLSILWRTFRVVVKGAGAY